MVVTIFGVGALGSLFGYRLHPHADAWLYGQWAAQIATVRERGLVVEELDGSVSAPRRLQMTSRLDEVPSSDVVIVLVKSQQTTAVSPLIAQILKPDGLVITLQNGLGNGDKLAAIVGAERVCQGITAQGATMLGAGRVRHAGNGVTHMARAGLDSDLVNRVAALLEECGIKTAVVDNADSLIWGKLAVNAAVNPLTALLELPNGALPHDPLLLRLLSAAANEVAALASAQQITLPYPDAPAHVIRICELTTTNHSSMLQDMRRGAKTEIEAICGAITAVGQNLRIPTPVNKRLWQLVKQKESGKLSLAQAKAELQKLDDL
ncbi:MAG: 2-dehydropantoate 2-reductase [Chloroflexota bacterium]